MILCTLGTRTSILRCLDSIILQDYPAEIIVVLNGAPNDRFTQSVSSYPIQLLNERKRGVCAARNYGVRRASGDILCFIDDDSVAHPDWILEIVRGFEDSQVACVVGRVAPEGLSYDPVRDVHNFHGERANSSWSVSPDPGWFENVMEGAIMGFGCNFAFRREFLLNHAMFPEDLGAGTVIGAADENHMFIQVLRHGFKIYHAHKSVVTHVFDDPPDLRKRRVFQLAAAWPAYLLKLLIEDKEHRTIVLKKILSSTLGFAFGARRKRSDSPETRPLPDLSRAERLRAFLTAPVLYLESRRSR